MKDMIIQGDCLQVMKDIPDKNIDMILCDLPYGITACKWDVRIPFEPLWEAYRRIIKDNGAIVLTASQPFTSELVVSNKAWFRHEWIYVKSQLSNFLSISHNPMKEHENIVVFGKNPTTFNPQMQPMSAESQIRNRYPRKLGSTRRVKGISHCNISEEDFGNKSWEYYLGKEDRHPASVQIFSRGKNTKLHSSEKPIALFEYLIKTYTNEGDLVLDNCIGSGTTAIACINLKRHWIGIEKEQEYVDIANKRVADAIYQRYSQPELEFSLAGG